MDDDLKDAKLEICNSLTILVERLDTKTAKKLMQWLHDSTVGRGYYFEFWQEEAELIYCTED